jgi:hypothetical protein
MARKGVLFAAAAEAAGGGGGGTEQVGFQLQGRLPARKCSIWAGIQRAVRGVYSVQMLPHVRALQFDISFLFDSRSFLICSLIYRWLYGLCGPWPLFQFLNLIHSR